MPEDNPDRLMSGDLKKALANELKAFIGPLRDELAAHRELFERTYPPKVDAAAAAGGGGGGKKKGGAAAAADKPTDVSRLDLRVGEILEAKLVENSEKLYEERIDLGNGDVRTVVSGLRKWVPLEKMQKRKVVVLCNLKPAK